MEARSNTDYPGNALVLDSELACDDCAPAERGTVEPRYAHAGRRRRRITEDLFRCKLKLHVIKQRFGEYDADNLSESEDAIACNALVWKTNAKMRLHLADHMSESDVDKLTDNQVRAMYVDASRIAQEGIPDNDEE